MLVSHFLLDLQEACQRTVAALTGDYPSATSLSIGGSMTFADNLGPIGAIVGPAVDHVQEEGRVAMDSNSVTTEGINHTEGETINHSHIGGEFSTTGVLHIRGGELPTGAI